MRKTLGRENQVFHFGHVKLETSVDIHVEI